MRRRTVVRRVGGLGGVTAVGLAGCLTRENDDPPNGPDEPDPDDPEHEGTLRIVTYRSMVTGTDPAGPWLTEAFEEEYPDAKLEWVVPESGLEHYLQRGERDAAIDADVCLGVTVGDLARIDERVGEGGLLRGLDDIGIDGVDSIRDEFAFDDPHQRLLPYDAGYVSLVYDGTTIEAPETFAELLEAEYADTLLAQHPRYSMPGQAFLLWSIATDGPDDAMDYWDGLVDNGVQLHRSWSDAYEGSYLAAERPLIVSYSTDPVFGHAVADEPDRHQVAFLEDEGYALPEGAGIFEATTAPDLATAFLEFLLTEQVQAELARRNVQFPAVEGVDVGPGFDARAREPSEPVTIEYSDLRGAVGDWLTSWTDRFGDVGLAEPSRERETSEEY